MNNKVITIDIHDNYRIVVISDIHAHLDRFKRLLDKVCLREEDYLVILGDFLDRGPESYETYKYIRALEKRPRTVVLKGNHESFMQRPFMENDHVAEIIDFLKTDPYRTLLHELAEYSTYDLYSCKDTEFFRQMVLTQYDEIMDYLKHLPILLYIDDFLFVHGGYDEQFKLATDETKFLKYDFFDQKSGRQEQQVVVGHFPACILRDDRLSNLPYFNDDKNIITIDGGTGVKQTGELNAFLIEKREGNLTYDCVQENDFEEIVIKQSHCFEEEDPVYVRWPHWDFEVLEIGKEMTLCHHIHTGKNFTVFNGLLEEHEEMYRLKSDFANTFLNLEAGTVVKKCKVFDDCVLVKHKDQFGWIKREQIE